MADNQKLKLVMIATIPENGIATFQAYEKLVLPLLTKHKGVLERRLRNDDGTVEIHIISFESNEAFEAYKFDPERLRHTHLFDKSGAKTELHHMVDEIV